MKKDTTYLLGGVALVGLLYYLYSKKTSTTWEFARPYVLQFVFEPRPKFTCGECKKKDHGYKKCSACDVTRYCSKECQRKHWKNHKEQCKKYQKAGEYDEDE
jgi:hypothetical protein